MGSSQSQMPGLSRDLEHPLPKQSGCYFYQIFRENSGAQEMAIRNADPYLLSQDRWMNEWKVYFLLSNTTFINEKRLIHCLHAYKYLVFAILHQQTGAITSIVSEFITKDILRISSRFACVSLSTSHVERDPLAVLRLDNRLLMSKELEKDLKRVLQKYKQNMQIFSNFIFTLK